MTDTADPPRREPQWGRTYQWVIKQCRGKPLAAHLYSHLASTYGYRHRTFHPDRQRLAAELGCKSVRTIARALDHLRDIDAIRTTERRRDGKNAALLIELVGIDYFREAPKQEDSTVPLAEQGDSTIPLKGRSEGLEVGFQGDSRVPARNRSICTDLNTKNPPTPLKRGDPPETTPRITRDDRNRAAEVMKLRLGRCLGHDPPCRSPAECRAKLAAEYAVNRVELERESLHAAMGVR